MDVIKMLKELMYDPGPIHSPNDECPCDMTQPCACIVYGAAIDELRKLRTENAELCACVARTRSEHS